MAEHNRDLDVYLRTHGERDLRLERAQTSADREAARRRPLLQYVIRKLAAPDADGSLYVIDRSTNGTKPSHALIFGAPMRMGKAETLEAARGLVTSVVDGARCLPRRRDDPADVVEVWV